MINSDLLAFTLGGPEVIIVLVLILLLFGAKRIPKLAKSIGQATGELKKAALNQKEKLVMQKSPLKEKNHQKRSNIVS